jgi:hypothetical protein
MFDWLEYATRLKHREFLQNAEAQQLIDEAMAARANDDPFYYEALAALGRYLSTLGERLQERYHSTAHLPLELTPLEHAGE